jgi:hypothetical protein
MVCVQHISECVVVDISEMMPVTGGPFVSEKLSRSNEREKMIQIVHISNL